ncbi:hypothetical protein [Prochlorococcus marinus]|uniref:hypothetical protein n=1 Tax=Prochlorococcus marinus TaxID=1219 RepID=UPI0022B2E1B5|nr:hypothetical protein [Prochlorococcus marinus]
METSNGAGCICKGVFNPNRLLTFNSFSSARYHSGYDIFNRQAHSMIELME